jgi:transcriptional regulator with XRE-family HTH domain
MQEDMSVGERIRYYRKRRGLSQPVLAGLVGRSTSWLRKVERGERAVDKLSVLRLLANVLKVEIGNLLGGIELPPNGGAPHEAPRGLHAVRRALYVPDPPDREPPTPHALHADVVEAKQLIGNGAYEQLSLMLADVITDARVAVEHRVPGAWWSLAGACQVTSSLMRNLGDTRVAWIAADRAITAARHLDDPAMVGIAMRDMGKALMYEGMLDEAASVSSNAADLLAPSDAHPSELWTVWGLLKLVEATAAARGDNPAHAWRVFPAVRAAAERLGSGRNDYWEAFGPSSVGVVEVAAAVESGDPVEALRIADRVDVTEMAIAERRARFCLYVAYAHVLRADDAAAVVQLVEGERHSRDVIRYHVRAREIVQVCLRRERQSRTPALRGLAERMGVLV